MSESGPQPAGPFVVCVFQGQSRREVIEAARRGLDRAGRQPGLAIESLAAELARDLRDGWLRLAVVAGSTSELVVRLQEAVDELTASDAATLRDPRGAYYADRPLAHQGRLAMVFPGDGSAYLNMLGDLRERQPEVAHWFGIADEVAVENHREPYSQVVYPPALLTARDRQRAEHRLRRLENSAAAVLTCNQALFELLGRLGVRPAAMIGHSLGDWSALGAAGVTRIDRFLRDMEHALALPGRVTRSSARMAIALADRELVEEVIDEVGGEVYVAMHNGPRRVIVAGAKQAVQAALDQLGQRGVVTFRLPFIRAAHTPMTSDICEPLAEVLRRWGQSPPHVELWSCTTAEVYPTDPAAIRRLAVDNMVRPVEFVRTIENAYAAGYRLFVECGAGGQLADCIADILADRPHLAAPADTRQRSGTPQLCHLLASLLAEGVNVDPTLGMARDERPVLLTPAPAPTAAPEPEVATGVGRFLADTAAALAAHTEAVRETLAVSERFTRRFMEAEAQVMRVAARRTARPRPAVAESARGRFIDEVVELAPGRRAVARHRLRPKAQPYLLDHSIGAFAPQGPWAMEPMRLIPLTVSVEIMAEVAALLFPGRVLVGCREVVARRPTTADGEPTIEIQAEVCGDGVARVQVATLGGEGGGVCTEGVMLFGEYPPPPVDEPFMPTNPRRPLVLAEELYDYHIMFHGPCYQGVSHLGWIGDDGLVGRLRALPRARLLADDVEPELCCDPALLDAAGQLFGYWPLERFEEDLVVFPTHVDRIGFYAPPPAPGEEVECRVRVQRASRKQLVGTIDLVNGGKVLTRIEGWRFWRFNWPLPIVHFMAHPGQALASEPLEALFDGFATGLATAVLVQPRALELLDFCVRPALTKAEAERYRALPDSERRQEQFYLGRLAAKDAVRRWLRSRGVRDVAANRIEILNDADGAPVVGGDAFDSARPPQVSLAHKPGIAVAVAVDGPVGVDVEAMVPRDDAFVAASFGPAERALLAPLGDEWVTRAWCAKEAVAKALRVGLRDPRALTVTAIEASSGEVVVRAAERTVTARTARSASWAVALATL